MRSPAVLFAAVYVANAAFNLANAHVARCPYTSFLVSLQLTTAAAVSACLAWAVKGSKPTALDRQIMTAGAFHFFLHAFMAHAFREASVSAVHMTRALEPLAMAMLETQLHGRQICRTRRASLVVLVTSIFAAACLRADSFSVFAFGCATLATAASCAKNLALKPPSAATMDPIAVQLAAALWSVPFALALDLPRSMLPRSTFYTYHWRAFWPPAVASGAAFGAYAWLGLLVLERVSATAFSVGNTVKRAVLVLLFSWDDPTTVALAAISAGATYVYSKPDLFANCMFEERKLAKYLEAAVPSADFVASVSEYVLRGVGTHHQQDVVNCWFLAARRKDVDPTRLLAQIFVMNDVLQRLGNRNADFKYAFVTLFAEVVLTVRERAPSIVEQLENLFRLWRERTVYNETVMDYLELALEGDAEFRAPLTAYVQTEIDNNYHDFYREFSQKEEAQVRRKLAPYYQTEVDSCVSAEHDPRQSIAAAAHQCPLIFPEVAKACQFSMPSTCEDVFLETSVVNDALPNEPALLLPAEETKHLSETAHLARSLEQQWTSLMGKYDIGEKLRHKGQREQLKVLKAKEFTLRAKLEATHLRVLRLLESRYRHLALKLVTANVNLESVDRVLSSKLQKGLSKQNIIS